MLKFCIIRDCLLDRSRRIAYHCVMAFHRYGKFVGGIDLPEEKQATIDKPIAPAESLRRLLIPLAPCGRAPATPAVAVGKSVAAGERIAVAKDEGVDIFAPLDGRVESITTAVVVVGRELIRTPAIELADLSPPGPIGPNEPVFEWIDAGSADLRDRLAAGQLTTSRLKPQPLMQWAESARKAGCRHLVAKAMEGQPYVTAEHRLLVEHAAEIVAGLVILAKAAEIEDIIIAVDVCRTGDYQALLSSTAEFAVNPVALPRKYPIGADAVLLKILLGKEIPCGGTPADIGAAVIDPSTCLAAYRWVACRQRLNARVVTVSGSGAKKPANLLVPFGANCYDLLDDVEGPVILGGPMVGQISTDEAVISPSIDAVLAQDPTPEGTSVQCIRCGWCRDHCPMRLNVAVLNDLYELSHIDRAERSGVQSCVQCGVCSYVCPARLDLTERVGMLKRTVRRMRRAMPLFNEPVGQKEGAS